MVDVLANVVLNIAVRISRFCGVGLYMLCQLFQTVFDSAIGLSPRLDTLHLVASLDIHLAVYLSVSVQEFVSAVLLRLSA